MQEIILKQTVIPFKNDTKLTFKISLSKAVKIINNLLAEKRYRWPRKVKTAQDVFNFLKLNPLCANRIYSIVCENQTTSKKAA